MENNTIINQFNEKSCSESVNKSANKGAWSKFLGLFGINKNKCKPEKKCEHTNINKNMWVPDDKAPTCYNCQNQFSAFFLRKHHCRICGNVFCKDCSSKTVDGKYWASKKEIKVCDYCYEMYKQLDETLVETTIYNANNYIENIDSIDDNIKNLKRETKLSEYCKKNKREFEEYFKFLQMDRKYEDGIKNNLENFYDQSVKHSIEAVLKTEGLYEKWFEKVYDLTKKIIAQVNPSFKDLKDTMNINDYIKIKTIPYKDQSQCKVIDGFALQKNVVSKIMNTNIDNPKILLLDCGLDYNRNLDNITNFENLMTLQPAYFNIIMRKIESVEPTVILLNKNVSRKIQEELAKNNKISLVTNVKSTSLKKIARCTKTYVLPSTDLIDQQTILGTCKKFRLEKIKTTVANCKLKLDPLKTNEYNLMIFEGCDYVLYGTIILSGPDEAELKRLKKIMRIILLTARGVYLQKSFLYYSYCNYPLNEDNWNCSRPSISSAQSKNSSSSSVNTIPNINIQNHFEGLQSHLIFHSNEKPSTFNVVRTTISQGQAIDKLIDKLMTDKSLTNQLQPGFNSNIPTYQQDLAESEVLKKVNSICEEPQILELRFYSQIEEYDKPLGKLIIDLCNEADIKCENCKKMRSSHIYYLYKNKKLGRLKIETAQTEAHEYLDNLHTFHNSQNMPNVHCMNKILELINYNNDNSDKDRQYNQITSNQKSSINKSATYVNYNMDIFFFGFCKICKCIVTPLVKLPQEIYNFSVAMFFRFMLFNHDLHNRSDKRENNLTKLGIASNECSHYVNRDINRIFITKNGIVKLTYEDSPLHIIETSPMNERSDNKYFSSILEMCITSAREKSFDVLSCLINNFKFYLDHLNEISIFLNNENITSSHVIIVNSLEIIKKTITHYQSIANDIMSFVDKILVTNKFDDYVKAIVFIKKVYFRIAQIKIVLNYIRNNIRKLKSTINFIVKMKITANNFENTPSNQQGNTGISSNYLPIEVESLSSSSYENIDTKETYKLILKEIMFFDDQHNKYSNENSECDLSSYIAYILTSDKYRDFICGNNKFKLTEVKCDRRERAPFDCMQFVRDFTRCKDIVTSDNEHTITINNSNGNLVNDFDSKKNANVSTSEDEIYETSLLFDQSKNQYHYLNLENHKIYQQLETELLSDDKIVFKLNFTNSNILNFLSNSNLSVDYTRKLTQFSASSTNTHSESEIQNDEQLTYSLKGDEIKSTIEELEKSKLDLNSIKESFNQNNDNKAKIKTKKLEFIENSIFSVLNYEVIVYYPRQFEALRITYCATYDEFILSIAKSSIWKNVSGGKSKADFYKSHDNKFILKCVNKHEFKMFIETGNQYFHHNTKFLFHKMPSALAKILGAYKIKMTNNNKVENSYVILMENMLYGKDDNGIKAYDLKGSKLNRYIPLKDQKPNQVLPDTNFKEDYKGEPIALERNMAELLKAAVHNDSLILSKMNVVDYSLLLIIDDNCNNKNINNINHLSKDHGHSSGCPLCNIKSIRVGIIDYVRKYTWDKQLEHVGKTLINGLQVPTIVNPLNYKERFKEAIDEYFIGL